MRKPRNTKVGYPQYQRALLSCGHHVLFVTPDPQALYCPYHGVQSVINVRPASDKGYVPSIVEYSLSR